MEDVELCIQVRLQLCMAILVFQINTFCKNYKGVGSVDIDFNLTNLSREGYGS